MTDENLSRTPSVKTNINEKEKEKDTVNQSSIENMQKNANKNAKKRLQNTQVKEDKRKTRTTKKITVLGDSILKHLSKKAGSSCKMYAATDCMEDYVKFFLKNAQDHFVLNLGINDLISDQTPEEIATFVINLAPPVRE